MSSIPCKLIKQGHKHSFGEKGGGREPYTPCGFFATGGDTIVETLQKFLLRK